MQVGLWTLALLVEQMSGGKTVEPIGACRLVRLAAREQVSETITGSRGCFESTVAPARVYIESLQRCAIDDRRAIHRHVHDSAPGAQHAHPPKSKHQSHA